jgi:hypothetical protein
MLFRINTYRSADSKRLRELWMTDLGLGTKIPNPDITAKVIFCQDKRRNFYTEGAETTEFAEKRRAG